jgi:hypothetical protein
LNPHSPVPIAIHAILLHHRSKTVGTHSRRPGQCGIPPDADRIELAERMREIIAAARKAEQGKRNDLAQNIPQNFAECSDPKEERETNARLGALAGGGRPCNISQQKPPQNFGEVPPDADRIELAGMPLSIQDNPPQNFAEGWPRKWLGKILPNFLTPTNVRPTPGWGRWPGCRGPHSMPPQPRESILPACGSVRRGTLPPATVRTVRSV